MTPAEAEQHIASRAFVIDVRTAAEYRRGHLPGAVHVPFWAAAFWRLPPIDPNQPVLVYCGHGPRARMASVALKARGLRVICLLEGHYARWRREGRKVVTE
jgi:rhodanese-related sulfurtransferase